jgi:hypothetical protein
MRYIACQNDACPNKGAPYTDPDAAALACPVCEKPMDEIPAPELTPPPPPPAPPPTPEEELASQRSFAAGRVQAALAATGPLGAISTTSTVAVVSSSSGRGLVPIVGLHPKVGLYPGSGNTVAAITSAGTMVHA